MKRILLVRSVPLDRDSRSTKMVSAYRARGHSVTALVWTRGEPAGNAEWVRACTARGAYGRKLAGVLARVRWFWFIAAYMLRHARSFDLVHTVDLDTAILVVPLARILGKRVIYDAFDHAAAMFKPGLLASALGSVERGLLHRSDLALFPDPARLDQYGISQQDIDHVIVGNIPDVPASVGPIQIKAGPLRLVYVGTLEAVHRGLEYIPDACLNLPDDIAFVVAGLGSLGDFFREKGDEIQNLTFLGQLPYEEALRVMEGADCLYGPYLLTTPAHRYAAPNKAYEHLALGRPLLTNSGTPVASLVSQFDSGYIFDGSFAGLIELLRGLNRDQCRACGQRALRAWQEQFASARERQLATFFSALDRLPSC